MPHAAVVGRAYDAEQNGVTQGIALAGAGDVTVCDHEITLGAIDLAKECTLWATMGNLLASGQSNHLRLTGAPEALSRLASLQADFDDVRAVAAAAGTAVVDDPKRGHPVAERFRASREPVPSRPDLPAAERR